MVLQLSAHPVIADLGADILVELGNVAEQG